MNELIHYGIPGMKWGRRKNRDKESIRRKIQTFKDERESNRERDRNIKERIESKMKRGDASLRELSDYSRIAYKTKSLPMRAGNIASSIISRKIVSDIFTNNLSRYVNMDRKTMMRELRNIAIETAAMTMMKDRLAKSASKNYEQDGSLKRGVNKNAIFTKEDIIERSVKTAVYVAPFLGMVTRNAVFRNAKKNYENRVKFESWGERILSSKVPNIVWQADDFSMDIIDER